MRGDWTSGLENLTRKGTREEILVRRLGVDEIEKLLGRERLESGSLENAQTWCICFLHVQAPAHKIHARKKRSSAPRSGKAVGRGALKFSTSPEPASRSLLPPAKLHRPVSLSPRVSTRVIPVACLRHSQRQFSASLLTSCLPCLLPLFSRPRSIEDYVEQQPTSDATMPRCQKTFRCSPGGEKPGPK